MELPSSMQSSQVDYLLLLLDQVFKGVKKYSGQVVAMKFITKANKNKRDLDSFRQEIVILQSLRHPNIIQMLDHYETEKEFIVITGDKQKYMEYNGL